MQTLSILGSTGSIGVSTLDVVARHPDRFQIFALAGHTQTAKLAEQCRQFKPRYAVVADEAHAAVLRQQLGSLKTTSCSKVKIPNHKINRQPESQRLQPKLKHKKRPKRKPFRLL